MLRFIPALAVPFPFVRPYHAKDQQTGSHLVIEQEAW